MERLLIEQTLRRTTRSGWFTNRLTRVFTQRQSIGVRVISLAHALKLTVIVEGVKRETQRDLLKVLAVTRAFCTEVVHKLPRSDLLPTCAERPRFYSCYPRLVGKSGQPI